MTTYFLHFFKRPQLNCLSFCNIQSSPSVLVLLRGTNIIIIFLLHIEEVNIYFFKHTASNVSFLLDITRKEQKKNKSGRKKHWRWTSGLVEPERLGCTSLGTELLGRDYLLSINNRKVNNWKDGRPVTSPGTQQQRLVRMQITR